MILLLERRVKDLIAFRSIIGGVWHLLVRWEQLQEMCLKTVTHL